MTPRVTAAQDALNNAYFAFQANPSDKQLADAYNVARDALIAALNAERQ